MARSIATAGGSTVLALVCLLSCRHEPDVVAQISEVGIDGGGRSGAGAGAAGHDRAGSSGGGGRAGAPASDAASGSAGSSSVMGDAGTAGSGGSGGSAASGGSAGSDSGAAGSAGADAAPPILACEFDQFAQSVAAIVEVDCIFAASSVSPNAVIFILSLPPAPTMGETEIANCQFTGERFGPQNRDDPNSKLMICPDLCRAAASWLERWRMLCESGLPGT